MRVKRVKMVVKYVFVWFSLMMCVYFNDSMYLFYKLRERIRNRKKIQRREAIDGRRFLKRKVKMR